MNKLIQYDQQLFVDLDPCKAISNNIVGILNIAFFFTLDDIYLYRELSGDNVVFCLVKHGNEVILETRRNQLSLRQIKACLSSEYLNTIVPLNIVWNLSSQKIFIGQKKLVSGSISGPNGYSGDITKVQIGASLIGAVKPIIRGISIRDTFIWNEGRVETIFDFSDHPCIINEY